MKQKKHLFLIALLPLLMSNSPAPSPTTDVYEDIEVQCAFSEFVDDTYVYNLTVKNTGTEYASALSIQYFSNDYYVHGYLNGYLFSNQYILPNQTLSLQYKTTTEFDFDNPEIKWYTYYFLERDDNYTFSDITVSPDQTGDAYVINSKQSGKGDYYYSYIVDVTYDGQDYAFEGLNFYPTDEHFDLNKLTVNKITAYKGTKHNNGYAVLWIFWFLIQNIHWFLLGMLVIGITLAILIPLLVRRKRIRNAFKKQEQIKKKEEESRNDNKDITN